MSNSLAGSHGVHKSELNEGKRERHFHLVREVAIKYNSTGTS